ncbi:hypothetical protein DPMN_046691 [Dreissena polymorpha]|uniref:Fibrinogen C-terminal domain-containing protein n=1 Tax=Dreissena polymorpha TaxID=45954 RepID=A0A9D4D7B0_DREPO|nr:hypothetical protein DPMN_046691 [Dreissena polymorpha]
MYEQFPQEVLAKRRKLGTKLKAARDEGKKAWIVYDTLYVDGRPYIHGLTKTAPTELRIDLVAADGSTAYEVFPNFLLSGSPYYALHVGKGNGTAGDDKGFSFTNGHVFSTLDHEKSVHCSSLYDAGWWYGTCCWAYLNGKYYTPGTLATGKSVGMFYHDFKGFEMLKETKMMFRRV